MRRPSRRRRRPRSGCRRPRCRAARGPWRAALSRCDAGTASPRRVFEQRMVHRRVVGAVLPPDAEADESSAISSASAAERARTFAPVAAELREREVGADRGVAAGDVEADTDHGDLVAVRGHAADRHDVAEMTVGHQRRTHGPRRHVLQLTDRQLVMVPEDHGHVAFLIGGEEQDPPRGPPSPELLSCSSFARSSRKSARASANSDRRLTGPESKISRIAGVRRRTSDPCRSTNSTQRGAHHRSRRSREARPFGPGEHEAAIVGADHHELHRAGARGVAAGGDAAVVVGHVRSTPRPEWRVAPRSS